MFLETVLGVVTGLVGPVITAVTNYKMQKLKNENDQLERAHQVALIKAQTDAMIEEAKAQIQITTAKVAGEVELAEVKAYQTSQEIGNQPALSMTFLTKLMNAKGWVRIITYPVGAFVALSFGVADWLAHMMRPALTAYLVGASTWITMLSWDIMQKHKVDLTTDQAIAIFNQNANTMVYLAVSCVTWWFADRRMALFLTRLQNGGKKGPDPAMAKNYVEYR